MTLLLAYRTVAVANRTPEAKARFIEVFDIDQTLLSSQHLGL
jgi:hypothetical protein